MKWLIALLVFAGVAGWQVSLHIDPDVFLVVIGVVFGVLASLPVGLLMLVMHRRSEGGGRGRGRDWDDAPSRGRGGYDYPPTIVHQPPQAYPALPQPQQPANPWTVTGGGSFDDMPALPQDLRFRHTGGR